MDMLPIVLLLKVLTGKSRDQLVFMTRIILESQDGDFPFVLRRRQFRMANYMCFLAWQELDQELK